MRITSRPLLRHLATAALLPALALGMACGQGPTAFAEDFGGLGTGSIDLELVIHKNDTVDVTYKSKIGRIDPSTYCNTGFMDDKAGIKASAEVVDGTCVMKATGASLSKANEGAGMKIRHEGGKYYFETRGNKIGPGSSGDGTIPGFTSTMTVVFPGTVTQASANGKISDNKVTWTNPKSGEALSAEASESSSSFMLWLILGVLFLLLVAGGIILAVALSGRKKKQVALAGGYPTPGTQPPAPGGYPTPGTQPPAPGGYAPVQQPYQQPGLAPQAPQVPPQQAPVSDQPYQQTGYGQPGTQPHNPNQGY
ncbi:LppM family (lipo)protein [Actinomyces trachealis]|uniref:LppM family (lipo)protein n=1 Tax=Actinomyces trachealis TaxID=2763540 RepID=UPI0018C5C7A0|nr:hypothetical protein [Actinomyces trachealis]